MRLLAIVAMSQNRVIGINNQLPWRLPADLKHFKQLTLDHTVIMGRKTHESIGKALPNRRNIVVTRDPAYQATENCEVVYRIDDAIRAVRDEADVFVMGGATIYESLLLHVEKIYLTLIHHDFEGDAFFPTLSDTEWEEAVREDHQADDANPYDYSFITLERKVGHIV